MSERSKCVVEMKRERITKKQITKEASRWWGWASGVAWQWGTSYNVHVQTKETNERNWWHEVLPTLFIIFLCLFFIWIEKSFFVFISMSLHPQSLFSRVCTSCPLNADALCFMDLPRSCCLAIQYMVLYALPARSQCDAEVFHVFCGRSQFEEFTRRHALSKVLKLKKFKFDLY